MNRTAGVTKEGEKKMDYSLVSWGPKLGSGPDPGQQRDYSAGYNVRDSKWQFVGVSAEEGQVLLSLEGALQNAAWHECEAHPDITGFPWLDRDRNGNLVEVHFRLAWGAGQKAGTPVWAILTPGGDLIPAKGYQGERWIWGRSRPSRYADWIAIGAQPISQPQSDLLEGARNQVWLDDVLVALAADGTLSAWQDPMQFLEPKCLCPTRRPIWSFNILAESR
jgi:hypothetical protein